LEIKLMEALVVADGGALTRIGAPLVWEERKHDSKSEVDAVVGVENVREFGL
jgi:hypothetical protein